MSKTAQQWARAAWEASQSSGASMRESIQEARRGRRLHSLIWHALSNIDWITARICLAGYRMALKREAASPGEKESQ
jgi:hypothetical protein